MMLIRRLRWILRALAQEHPAQIALFPGFVEVADELALEWEETLDLVSEASLKLSSEQRDSMEAVDVQLLSMSGTENGDFWNDEALAGAPEWMAVRREARAALACFGWAAENPGMIDTIYLGSENGKNVSVFRGGEDGRSPG